MSVDSSGGVKLRNAVTVWNDSGGVGKTTVAINTAEELSEGGADVLVIDLDPQYGGLTDHAGYEAALRHPEYNIVDALLMPNRSLSDIVVESSSENGLGWDLIPAHVMLEEFESKLASNLPLDENRLVQLRKGISEAGFPLEYEFILIDCPASRGSLVANAIASTRNVLIPTELSRKGVRSVDGLVSFVQDIQLDLRQLDDVSDDISTGVVSVVPNKAAKMGRLTNNEVESMMMLLDNHLSIMPDFYVPSRTILKESWMAQMPLREYLAQDTTRDIRGNETQVLEMFTVIAEAVRVGSISEVCIPDSLCNIPRELYPEGREVEQ